MAWTWLEALAKAMASRLFPWRGRPAPARRVHRSTRPLSSNRTNDHRGIRISRRPRAASAAAYEGVKRLPRRNLTTGDRGWSPRRSVNRSWGNNCGADYVRLPIPNRTHTVVPAAPLMPAADVNHDRNLDERPAHPEENTSQGDKCRGSDDGSYTMEMASRDAAILRREAIESYNQAAASMEAWRDNYRRTRENHDRGRAPSIPSIVKWELDCSRTDFDRQHLREAMRRSTQVVRKEKYVYEMLVIARDAGLEPLDWQHRAFPTSDPHYYTESQENALAAAAPFESIHRWGGGLPEEPMEMGGPVLADAEYNPAGYGGDQEVEVPGDADLLSGKEPEPGDSASCRADDDTRATIRERQALERPG